MKPLLVAPLTSEDQRIWDRWIGRRRMAEWDADHIQAVSIASDRRDADLMWRAQSNRWCAVPPDFPGAVYAEDPPFKGPQLFACGPVGGDISWFA